MRVVTAALLAFVGLYAGFCAVVGLRRPRRMAEWRRERRPAAEARSGLVRSYRRVNGSLASGVVGGLLLAVAAIWALFLAFQIATE